VQKVIEDHSAYGIRRMKAALLEEHKTHIGRDALAKLLLLWGLNIRRKIKKKKISLIKKILLSLSDKTNLLIRAKIVKPFQAITSDISEIIYNNGKSKAYLAVHKDAFGQMVYGWHLAETMETELVINSFQMALRAIKKIANVIPEKLICHQDQGSQYTSYEYVDLVLKNKLILSYSAPGTPTDNPGQESFFGRLKDDNQAEFNEVKNFKKLEKLIKNKMKYYNNKRLHTSLKNKSPKKFTINFIKNLSLF